MYTLKIIEIKLIHMRKMVQIFAKELQGIASWLKMSNMLIFIVMYDRTRYGQVDVALFYDLDNNLSFILLNSFFLLIIHLLINSFYIYLLHLIIFQE